MQETRVGSPGQEGPSEKGVAAHSHVPAWRVLWTEELGGSSPCGLNQWAWLKRLSMRAGGRGLAALAEPSVSFSLGWLWLHSHLGLGCSPSSLVGRRVQILTVVGPMPEALGGCRLSPCAFWQRGRFCPEAKTRQPDAFSLWPLDPTQDNLPSD